MASPLWRRIAEEREQQKVEEERKRTAAAADWARLRSFFQARLAELGAPPTITFRHYVLPDALYPTFPK